MNNRRLTYRQYLNKKRRTQIIKKKIKFTLFTSILVLFLSITLFSMKANAASNDMKHEYKYFRSITVNSNDTLWDYATMYSKDDNYKAYIKEVKKINHLGSNEIHQGMRLIIPYYSNDFM